MIDTHVKYNQIGNSEDVQDWVYTHVSNKLVRSGGTIFKYNVSGITEKKPLEFVKEVAELANVQFRVVEYKGRKTNVTYVGTNSLEESYLQISSYKREKDDHVEIAFTTATHEEIVAIEEYCKKNIIKSKENSVYVIASTSRGLALHNLGPMETELERGNYAKDVLDGYDYIVEQFKNLTPYGRLGIINGPPGTGKTYLVRSLISELKNCLIVLLPSKLVSEIDSPQLITLLAEEKSEYGMFAEHNAAPATSPILFVVEDADACLLPREGDNVMTISSLLNYTDGILGSMLDLRVIATTNAERIEFDEALTRPGRMCRHIHVGPLSSEKSSEVYERLTGNKKEYKGKSTLAQVYADAKGGFKEQEKEKKTVGFGSR